MASSPANVGLSDPEQDKWLEDAKEFIKKQTYFMKRAIDAGNVRDVLRFASAMTGELRTSRLSPKNYYDLFMLITDELRELELFVEDEDGKGDAAIKTIVELYEEVQHAGNIIPRLYLLITIASVYIRSKKAPAKDVLFDLVELCRGVQHPMRGLFLRHYLSQISKDKLPDIGSSYEGDGGNFKDAIEFILQNFGEMNKLWVRMQSQGAVRDKQRREKERRNLRQLVGTNLVRLSELHGVDLPTYQEIVLPRVLEQIINCKDVIAQEYLMDAIIQVFSVDFHLMTLEQYLSSCAQLQDSVNVKDIIIALMNKLAAYAHENPTAIPAELDMFPLFHKYTSQIINSNAKVTLQDALALQVALINFASRVYPERLDYIDNVLGFTVEVLKKAGSSSIDGKAVNLIVELLSLPLDSLQLQILSLANFAPLLGFLDLANRRRLATNIITAIVKARSPLDTVEKVDKLLTYIAPAIYDEVESQSAAEADRFEFDLEQQLVARLFHLIANDDTDVHFQLYQTVRKHFGKGGKDRIEFTLPPLIYGSLQLAQRIFARESAGESASIAVKAKKVFGFVHETITVLRSTYSELAFRLFIQAGQTADLCAYDPIAYEYIVQAFLTYEEEIAESKAQFAAVTLLVASLASFKNLTQESYDTLVSKATQHASKLLKKTDQCKAVSLCAQMFWPLDEKQAALRDEKRVLACLQRALKIANGCVGHQVPLFVEILNQYLYFYDKQCPSITVKYLKGLISLIDEHLKTLDLSTEANKQAKRYYENTLAHIKFKQESDQAARFLEITGGEKEASTSFDD